MKRLVLAMLSFLIVIGLLVAVQEGKINDFSLEKVNAQEVIEYSKIKTNNDQKVDGELYVQTKKEKGESVVLYGERIFLTGEYSIIIIDTALKEKKIISFEYFQPLELVAEDNLLYVIGVYDSLNDIVVDEDHVLTYDKYECQVSIFDIETMTEIRYLRFNNGYYASSYILGQTIVLCVHVEGIIDEESNELIYPYYEDNNNEKVYLSHDQLYLSRNNDFIDSLTFIVRLDVDNNITYSIGLIGVEGIEKISDSKLLIATSIYVEEDPLTVIYIIDLFKTVEYKGYVAVNGNILSANSMEIYHNYLRVLTTCYLNDNITNNIYNINLNNIYLFSNLELTPIEDIALVEFKQNAGYITSYDLTYPLYLIDFSSAKIKVNKEFNLDFVGEQVVYGQTSFDIIGRKLNNKKLGSAICIGAFDLITHTITKKLIRNFANVEFDGLWNNNSVFYYDDKVLISFLSNGYQKILVVKKGSQFLEEKVISVDEYCRCIIVSNNTLYAIGFNKIYEYNLSDYQIINTFLI